MNEQALTTEQVVIQQASIDMKVIRIGKKQMTLSVFKQLQEESIIDTSGAISGAPWGRVNYHDKCGSSDHLHVIWQKGNELRQSYVSKSTSLVNELKIKVREVERAIAICNILDGDDSDCQSAQVLFRAKIVGMVRREYDRSTLDFFEKWLGDHGFYHNISECEDGLWPARERYNRYEAEFDKSYMHLAQLDQLFIAV